MTQQQIDLAGDGGSSFSWGPVGTQPGGFVQGAITALAKVQKSEYQTGKPEFWENGDPIMQYRVTLQTELRDPQNPADDGRRDVYLDGSQKARDNNTMGKLAAVLDAVRKTTGGSNLQVGGRLTLQWQSGMGYTGDPRNFVAWYEAPSVQLAAPAPGQQPGAAPAGPPPSVQDTVNAQAAQGQLPPQWAQPPAAPPAAPPQAPPQAPPAAAQQYAAYAAQAQPAAPPVQPQLPIPAQGPPPAQQYSAPPAAPPAGPPPPVQAAPAAGGHSPETLAALRAAGIDPATVPVQ